MIEKLRILHLEDSRNDAELIKGTLTAGGIECDISLTDNREDFTAALERERFDLILADYNLPTFDGLSALLIASEKRRAVPFLFVSGTMGEEIAVESLKHGATDYIVKGNLARLVPSIKRALHEKDERTARERAEKALSESEDRYRSLFNNSMDAVLLTVPDGGILSANKAACRMFDRTEEEIRAIGRKGLVDPADPRLAPLLEERARTGRATGELLFVRKDGSRFPGEVSSLLFEDARGEMRTSMVIRDITERKQAEEALRASEAKFRHLVENLGKEYFFYRHDINGIFTYVSPSVTDMLGYLPQEIASHYSRYLTENPINREVAHYTDLNLRGIQQAPYLLELLHKDGSARWLEVSEYPARDQSGNIIAIEGIARDITERAVMEEHERLASRKWQATFDAIRDAVCLLDLNGTILQCNKAMADFLRKPESEILGGTCWELMHGASGPIDSCPVTRMKVTLQREHRELQVNGKWISITVDPIMDETGKLTGAVHITSDVSERKAMEQGLRDSLDKFRSVAEQSLVGIYIIQDGVFKYVNKTFADIFHYSAEELTNNRSPRDITVPEDWDIVEEFGRRRGMGTSSSGSYEIRGLRKDGEVISVEIYESRALFEGRTANIGALLDISQRKKAEQAVRDSEGKLQAITRTAQDAIVLLTDRGTISYWNPAAEMMFGYSAGEVVGKEPAFIMPERFREPHAQAFKRFAETGEGPKLGATMEITGLRRDGTEFPLELSISGFLLDNKRHASGIIRDITERKKLEAQLLHAQKMEAIGTLAGGIAHDFNNILNVIIGYGSLVLEGMEADDPSWDRMREVLAAADRAANLTKRLLTFSRKEVVDFKHILVDDIVSGVEKLLSRIIGEDIELRIQLAGKKAVIFSDAGQLEQVLMNLVANARDAMPTGGCLAISTGSATIDDGFIAAHGFGTVGKYASISISDTGVGMNAETQSKIFEPFYTTKGVGEGTGLGLSIAYGIIKQHKGFIQVYSETGRGSVFKILLPMSDEAAGEPLVADTSELQGGTETILIAEDEAPLRDLMRIILESFGYAVLAAEDGEEAERMFLEHRDRIRLVILDMIMPKKSGKDAADEIKKVRPGIRILFMSGYSEDMIKKQGMTEEGLEYVQKPVSPKVLLKKVRELLNA
jgi:PAS domain S-box-containing protein